MQKNVLNLDYCQSSVIIPYPLEQMDDSELVLISFVPEQLEPFLSCLSDLLHAYSHSSMSLIVVCPPEHFQLESLSLVLETLAERFAQLNLLFFNDDLSFQDNIRLIQAANYFIYDSAHVVERLFIAMSLNKKIIYFESSQSELFAKLPSGCALSLAEAINHASAYVSELENVNIRAIALAHLDSFFFAQPNFHLQIEYINQENADYYLSLRAYLNNS